MSCFSFLLSILHTYVQFLSLISFIALSKVKKGIWRAKKKSRKITLFNSFWLGSFHISSSIYWFNYFNLSKFSSTHRFNTERIIKVKKIICKRFNFELINAIKTNTNQTLFPQTKLHKSQTHILEQIYVASLISICIPSVLVGRLLQ